MFCADKFSTNSARDIHWTVRVLHMMFCYYPVLINTGIYRNISESSGSYLSHWVYRYSIFMFIPLSSAVHSLLFVFENIANQNTAEDRIVCTLAFLSHCFWFYRTKMQYCRSQWPRGLRRRSAAARLLRLWVRIVVCCQVEVSATGWSLVQRSPTDCDASLCVI